MSKQIDDFKTSMDDSLSKIKAGLANISGDQANLAKQISDLSAKAGQDGSLSGPDLAALTVISQQASDLATQTQTLADSVPDVTVAG